jgi:hypothetical protein
VSVSKVDQMHPTVKSGDQITDACITFFSGGQFNKSAINLLSHHICANGSKIAHPITAAKRSL